MILKIGGLDITQYTARGGIKWQRADIDGSNAGRLKNGDMQRDRVATKIRWDVTCRPLSPEEVSKILTAIQPEYVTVSYTDPVSNTVKTGQFYSNNFPMNLLGVVQGGGEVWTGLTFPLIQK